MGAREGTLFSSTTGSRVADYDDLPPFMQEDIAERLPLYAAAPPCVLDTEDVTSWIYFRDHFDEYLRGEQFPVPAPKEPSPKCQF